MMLPSLTSSVATRMECLTIFLCCSIAICMPSTSAAESAKNNAENHAAPYSPPSEKAKRAIALTQEARSFETQGKPREALLRYEEVISSFDGRSARSSDWRLSLAYSVNYLYYAELLTTLKQYEKALASYSQVIKLYENSDQVGLNDRVLEALSGRSDLFALIGKSTEARAGYKQLIQRTQESPGVEDRKRLMRARGYLALPEPDAWSGMYQMQASSKDNAKPIPTALYEISKLPALEENKVAQRYQSDLARWKMAPRGDEAKQFATIRRFLLSDDINEYQEFGWTQLYLENKIECLDAGHFFFCKTEPGKTIQVGATESYISKTGYFGIMLHTGVFDLVKINGQ